MNFKQLNTLEDICVDVMRCDLYALQKRVRSLQFQLKNGQKVDSFVFQQLSADIEKSLKKRQFRADFLPEPEFPDDLPVSMQRDRIADALAKNQVIVVAGETGSGKTTQLPKICLSLKRGISGLIGCTQPRRIAARTIAMRVASELNSPLGQIVGYKVRFSDHVSESSYIKFMTDGILLAETQSDRFLNAYDTIILDEAHERSLNIDFLLGYIKQLLPKRPDLKLIITSATIDTRRFSEHFNNAPVLEISGRTYPVEVRYRPLIVEESDEEDRDMTQGILEAVDEITLYDRNADTLIFLAGERDIRETAEALSKHRLFNTEILPLYARLSASEQNRVFSPGTQRRIVLATNVAETSLTVPRIKAVIDTGLARISRYSIRNKVQRLPIEAISRSSANQRKGRCGRISAGLCIRLYAQEDFEQRTEFTEPEILRTSLASVILQMLALRLGEISAFPFIDPPSSKMINDGFNLLIELSAVNDKRQLTEIGWQLSKMPIDPRIGRMILAAKFEACLKEVLIIASALSIQDPRERPMDAQQAADSAQEIFVDKESDFLSYLKLWNFFQEHDKHLSQNKLRKLCRAHFLSYLRMREWQDIHQQLSVLVKENGWQINQVDSHYNDIHRALLTGLLGNIAFKTEINDDFNTNKKMGFVPSEYLGARNIKLFLFPGSGVFKKQPKWAMAAELVETTKLYARCVARISPDWIEQLAGDLCQHHYFEPHWEKNTAQVGAYERVTLYGLTIVLKRKVNYGLVDSVMSREIFIRHALVYGEYTCNFEFFKHNQLLIQEVESLEHRSRRRDILVDEEHIFAFYDARIPNNIYSGQTFEKWLKHTRHQNPKLLFLDKEYLMQHSGDDITPQAFPDYIDMNGVTLSLQYHFEPAHEQDGVTVDIPLALLNQLSLQPFEWLVPALLEEKIIALLRSMPKSIRRAFVPVPEVARAAVETIIQPKVSFREGGSFLEYPKESLLEVLSRFCHRWRGLPLPENVWNVDALPPHLLMNFQLIEEIPRIPLLSKGEDKALKNLPFNSPLLKMEDKGKIPPLSKGEDKALKNLPFNSSLLKGEDKGKILVNPPFLKGEDKGKIPLVPPLLKGEGKALKNLPFTPPFEKRILDNHRNLLFLQEKWGNHASTISQRQVAEKTGMEQDNITTWNFGDLPEQVTLQVNGLNIQGFPTLIDRETCVDLRISDNPKNAQYQKFQGMRRLFLLNLPVKKWLKDMPITSKLCLQYRRIGSCEQLKNDMLFAVIDGIFLNFPLPTTRADFEQRLSQNQSRVMPMIYEYVEQLTKILEEYYVLTQELNKFSQSIPAIVDIQEQVNHLIYEGFLKEMPLAQLKHLPRYLKAIALRLARLRNDPRKDERKASELSHLWQNYWKKYSEQHSKFDKEVLKFRWMLEELRVSLFAPELKTDYPVSVQRLEKIWKELGVRE